MYYWYKVGILQSISNKSSKTSILTKYQNTKHSAGTLEAHQSYVGCVVRHITPQLFSSQEYWEAKQQYEYFWIFLKCVVRLSVKVLWANSVQKSYSLIFHWCLKYRNKKSKKEHQCTASKAQLLLHYKSWWLTLLEKKHPCLWTYRDL